MLPGKWGIQWKIAIAVLVAGLLPALAGISYTYLSGTNALKKAIGANFQTLAEETADKIDVILTQEIDNARALALSPLLIGMTEKARIGHLSKYSASIPQKDGVSGYIHRYHRQKGRDIIAITVLDRRGDLIFTTDEKYHEVSLQNKTLWDTLQNKPGKGVFVSDIYYDETLQIFVMYIAVPITDDRIGEVLGNVIVIYNVKEIFEVINSVRIGETGHANLIASDGVLVACPLFPPQSHRVNSALLRQISGAKSGWGIAVDDAHGGKDSIIGYSPVKSTLLTGEGNFGGKAWHIFIRQIPEEAYAPIYALLGETSILSFILVGFLSLLSYFVSKTIVHPIKILSDGAHTLGQGQLNHYLHVKTGDEIEELAQIFNQMARNLEKRERQLLQSERIAALSQFSSTFAHDLRNPIIAIKKTLEMLRDSSPLSQKDGLEALYTDLISSCGLLLGLVNDVLDIHQVSYRDLPLLYSSFSLRLALEEVSTLLRIEAEAKEIRIDIEGDKDLWIEGDRRRIQRVFINLLTNAIRYSPQRGRVRISFETSPPDSPSGPLNLLFKIEDEGPGIAQSDLPKVFDLFYKRDTDGIKSGTGLGLYFCKVVVEAHGGKIWAENREGAGAAFSIILPIARRDTDEHKDSYSR